MYLAETNIALLRMPLDEPDMAGFAAQTQSINELAEESSGFIWRFTEAYSPRTKYSPWDNPLLIFNMSVWADHESLHAFVTSSEHLAMMKGRERWLRPVPGCSSATWWIDNAMRPVIDDAVVALSRRTTKQQAHILNFATEREQTVWQAVINQDGLGLARLFSDDYTEVTFNGRRLFKNQIVEESPQADEITNYSMDSEEVMVLADGTLLLSYHVTIEGTLSGEPITPKDRWATSIWRRDDGCWKCCFFQQSPYPIQRSQ